MTDWGLTHEFVVIDVVNWVEQLTKGILQSLYLNHVEGSFYSQRCSHFGSDVSQRIAEHTPYLDSLLINVFIVDVSDKARLRINVKQHRRLDNKVKLVFEFIVLVSQRLIDFVLSINCCLPVVRNSWFLHCVELTLPVD